MRDVGGHFLWVGGDGWMWVEVYFKCEEMGKHFLRVGADRWGCILVGWRWGGHLLWLGGSDCHRWRYILGMFGWVEVYFG